AIPPRSLLSNVQTDKESDMEIARPSPTIHEAFPAKHVRADAPDNDRADESNDHRAHGGEEMKWSNLEMDVGVLSARWPKVETTYWNALRESVDGVRQMMRLLNDRM